MRDFLPGLFQAVDEGINANTALPRVSEPLTAQQESYLQSFDPAHAVILTPELDEGMRFLKDLLIAIVCQYASSAIHEAFASPELPSGVNSVEGLEFSVDLETVEAAVEVESFSLSIEDQKTCSDATKEIMASQEVVLEIDRLAGEAADDLMQSFDFNSGASGRESIFTTRDEQLYGPREVPIVSTSDIKQAQEAYRSGLVGDFKKAMNAQVKEKVENNMRYYIKKAQKQVKNEARKTGVKLTKSQLRNIASSAKVHETAIAAASKRIKQFGGIANVAVTIVDNYDQAKGDVTKTLVGTAKDLSVDGIKEGTIKGATSLASRISPRVGQFVGTASSRIVSGFASWLYSSDTGDATLQAGDKPLTACEVMGTCGGAPAP